MSNTRRFNLLVAKRQKINKSGAYRDRAVLPGGHHVHEVQSREGHLTSFHRMPKESQRSPQKGLTPWFSGNSWLPEDDLTLGLDSTADEYNAELMRDDIDINQRATKKKYIRSQTSKRPHVIWKEKYRDRYLDEMLRWEGRGDFYSEDIGVCPDCNARKVQDSGEADHRCEECSVPILTCAACCVRRHRLLPFHHIQRWTGVQFVRMSLKTMGLRIQLNHVSSPCPSPNPCHKDFKILHVNGIHDVSLDFCGCEREIPNYTQLLRRGLFPATQLVIKTAATFQLLRQFHMIKLTAKIGTYDLYRALDKLTDNIGVRTPRSRYRALIRILLQWAHLKMLKRAGRGHAVSGVEGTKDGELAILCPSCPHPGINLPEGWEEAPMSLRFLYTLIICMDANFRLKNQMVSSYSADPGLGIGWSYMLPRRRYEAYVLSRADEKDISTCVGLNALAQKNTRYSAGLRYTGVNMVSCGRSEMILPCAVGNLHKGERYANMDYAFGSAIAATALLIIIISYDIACQWFVHLHKRIDAHWPEEIKPRPDVEMRSLIPKLHEPGHEAADHEQYSFNYGVGVGNTDGECPERIWGPHNVLGNSTKTQGPGSRHDIYDDNFGFWNWLKYCSMGLTLIRRYKAAVKDRNIQVEGHRGLTANISDNLVSEWTTLCETWENDARVPKKAKNPYHTDGVSLSESEVRKELAAAEKSRLDAGGIALHEMSPGNFLYIGLELEESQRRIRGLVKDKSTSLMGASLADQRNVLRNKIANWELIRGVYLPGLLQFQHDTSHSTPASDNPEDIPLFLPSSLPSNRRSAICVSGLSEMEEKLRTAQCNAALDGIRHILRVKSRMVHFKNKNIRGQREGTRSRTVIDRVHERARNLARKYRAAREAKMNLSGPGDWESMLRVLNDGDLRSYQDPNKLVQKPGRRGTVEDEVLERIAQAASATAADEEENENIDLFPESRTKRDGTGQTRRTLSWIWTVNRTSADQGDDSDDILRSEWAKSRARAARATEEVLLLREEMRRVLQFLDWKARWWTERQGLRVVHVALQEGLNAYAVGQASIQRLLSSSFRDIWRTPLADIDGVSDHDEASGQTGNALEDSEEDSETDGENVDIHEEEE